MLLQGGREGRWRQSTKPPERLPSTLDRCRRPSALHNRCDAAPLHDQPAPRRCRLDIYVCDYLRKRSLHKCAELFAVEANVPDRQLGVAQPLG